MTSFHWSLRFMVTVLEVFIIALHNKWEGVTPRIQIVQTVSYNRHHLLPSTGPLTMYVFYGVQLIFGLHLRAVTTGSIFYLGKDLIIRSFSHGIGLKSITL